MDSVDPHINPLFLRSNFSFSISNPAAIENMRQAEETWVAHIKKELRQAECRDSSHRPSIFMAPSPLRGLKHEAFVPQVVALGPYHNDLGPHHSSFPRNEDTERYKALAAKEMEMHKVMASKYVEKTLRTQDFSAIVKEFLGMVGMVRAEYYTELVTCKVDEKLAYMLALDACFVVEVLRSNGGMGHEGGFHTYYCKRFPRPLRKSVLQDFMLLENQIPLFLLLRVIRMSSECGSDEKAEKLLGAMVEEVARETVPFDWGELGEQSVKAIARSVKSRKHLLDCLYGIVTSEEEEAEKGSNYYSTKSAFGRGGGGAGGDYSTSSSLGKGEETNSSSCGMGVPFSPTNSSLSGGGAATRPLARAGAGGGLHVASAPVPPPPRGKCWFSSLWPHRAPPTGPPPTPAAPDADEEMGDDFPYFESAGGGATNNEHNLVESPTHFLSAMELQNAGIQFKPMDGRTRRRHKGGRSMVSVKYDERRAVLYIPKIRVGDETEGFFRNLIAYESQKGGDVDEVGVLSYLRFMNSLVDTPEDVALLVEKGVIAQDIGSNEEVAMMWNQLCVNTMRVWNRPYERVAKQLMRHTRRKTNTLKAEFKRTYLSRPWFLVSLLSAASLIIMTLVIMLYTIALYEKEVKG